MSDAEWFEVAWSRYLDPDLRGGTELGVDWELSELKTVHEGIRERQTRAK